MQTSSGNYKMENGIITHITGEREFNDYLELLDALVGGDIGILDGAVDAAAYYAGDMIREWDWEMALPLGEPGEKFDSDILWDEAEWFQKQVNYLFGVDDWREIEDWKTFSEKDGFVLHKKRFGEI